MAINVTLFELVNVADTCAVWNVLSSASLYRGGKSSWMPVLLHRIC